MNTPNFLVIGAQKAGTTSLYHYLKQHPAIFMPTLKEPHFFSSENEVSDEYPLLKSNVVIRDIENYRKLFKNVQEEIAIGEASPSYLYWAKTPETIKYYIPEVKLIAILRQPIERAYSNYLHAVRIGVEKNDNFEEAINEEFECRKRGIAQSHIRHYYAKGFYSQQLQRYYNLFDQEQIKIWLFDELTSNPHKVMKEMYNFLGVDSAFTPDVSERHNTSGIPKNPISKLIMKREIKRFRNTIKKYLPNYLTKQIRKWVLKKAYPLSAETRARLTQKYYSEEIPKLQALIDRDLSAWIPDYCYNYKQCVAISKT